jgi:polyisoprenyl-phosphate glycosyltransferase
LERRFSHLTVPTLPQPVTNSISASEALRLNLRRQARAQRPFVSCVVPVFNEEANIEAMLAALHRQLSDLGLDHEIVVVDDGSHDQTLVMLHRCLSTCPLVLVELSRNFGKELALSAGLAHVSGDVAILIDADFQHPPELIPRFIERWAEGYDMVFAVREGRQDEGAMKRGLTRLFYWLLNLGERNKIPENTQDFRLLDRCVVEALQQLPERNRFMKGLYNWVGFTRVALPVRTDPRRAGTSGFGFRGLFTLAITGLTAFSNVPLRLWIGMGALVSLVSMAYGAFILVETLVFGNPTDGWPTLVVAILFLGGIQLLSIGILGEYLGRVFTEVKQRPVYLVSRVTKATAANARKG